jgi:hypothetical protein
MTRREAAATRLSEAEAEQARRDQAFGRALLDRING